jgi:hypothetical protein
MTPQENIVSDAFAQSLCQELYGIDSLRGFREHRVNIKQIGAPCGGIVRRPKAAMVHQGAAKNANLLIIHTYKMVFAATNHW